MAERANRLEELEARNAWLEAQLGLYRDAIEHMQQGVCMFDEDGRIAVPQALHPYLPGLTHIGGLA